MSILLSVGSFFSGWGKFPNFLQNIWQLVRSSFQTVYNLFYMIKQFIQTIPEIAFILPTFLASACVLCVVVVVILRILGR